MFTDLVYINGQFLMGKSTAKNGNPLALNMLRNESLHKKNPLNHLDGVENRHSIMTADHEFERGFS